MIGRNFKWVAGLSLFLALGYLFFVFFKDGELGQKSKFALLQSVEYKYRNVPMIESRLPILLMSTKDRPFSILGLPLISNPKNFFWIILDDEHPGGEPIKSIPENAEFFLSCGYLSSLKDKVHVTVEVNNFLYKRCRDN